MNRLFLRPSYTLDNNLESMKYHNISQCPSMQNIILESPNPDVYSDRHYYSYAGL